MVFEVRVLQLCTLSLPPSQVVVAGDNILPFPHLPYIISPEPILSPWPVTRFWLLCPLITPIFAIPSWFLRSHPQYIIFSFVGFSEMRKTSTLSPWPSGIPHSPAGQLNSYSSRRGDIWANFTWIVEKASNLYPRVSTRIIKIWCLSKCIKYRRILRIRN